MPAFMVYMEFLEKIKSFQLISVLGEFASNRYLIQQNEELQGKSQQVQSTSLALCQNPPHTGKPLFPGGRCTATASETRTCPDRSKEYWHPGRQAWSSWTHCHWGHGRSKSNLRSVQNRASKKTDHNLWEGKQQWPMISRSDLLCCGIWMLITATFMSQPLTLEGRVEVEVILWPFYHPACAKVQTGTSHQHYGNDETFCSRLEIWVGEHMPCRPVFCLLEYLKK